MWEVEQEKIISKQYFQLCKSVNKLNVLFLSTAKSANLIIPRISEILY